MIKKIELKRFKKFEHTTISIGEFAVLVGENSSGKTSVLQAINLAMNAFSRLRLYSTDGTGAKPRSKGVGSRQLPGILNDDFRELYFGKKSRNGRESGNTIGAEIYLTDENNNRYGMQISSLFGGYNLTPLSNASDLKNNAKLHEKEALLISGFVGLSANEEKALSLSIRNRLRDGRASEIIRNLLLDTKDAVPDNYEKLIKRLKKDFGFVIDKVAFDEETDINVHAYYDEQINGKKIPFDFCSSGSGMMQVLQILTSIYRYCPRNATVVLLDEPDAHLHSNMQVALFYSLREIQKELNIQVIISTHSTSIISAALPSEIIPISDVKEIEPLSRNEEVDELVSERINSYELSKIKSNGVLVFFEDSNIDYFLKCDQLLNYHCLIGPRTVAYLTGRAKDDKLPFHIKPVIQELLGRNLSIYAIRDRDGLSSEITDILIHNADEANINYHFLNYYEIESYLLIPDLIYRTLVILNPEKEVPPSQEIESKICEILSDTIRLAKYKYSTVLEDNLYKLSSFKGLEKYRSANDYRDEAELIRSNNEQMVSLDDLRRVGMGKETIKGLMRWINEDLHLKISKKKIIESLDIADIPEEICDWFSTIKEDMKS